MGRTIRYVVLAVVGALYGSALLRFFQAHHQALLIVAIVSGIAGGAAIGLYMWKQHRKRKQRSSRRVDEAKVA
jgi:uncharacterized membrane protein YeaQ/YmgE (transglycosylase-associated protein family)